MASNYTTFNDTEDEDNPPSNFFQEHYTILVVVFVLGSIVVVVVSFWLREFCYDKFEIECCPGSISTARRREIRRNQLRAMQLQRQMRRDLQAASAGLQEERKRVYGMLLKTFSKVDMYIGNRDVDVWTPQIVDVCIVQRARQRRDCFLTTFATRLFMSRYSIRKISSKTNTKKVMRLNHSGTYASLGTMMRLLPVKSKPFAFSVSRITRSVTRWSGQPRKDAITCIIGTACSSGFPRERSGAPFAAAFLYQGCA